MPVVSALQALVDDDADAARSALRGDTSLLGSALAQHLDRQTSGSVYDAPAAFEAFIRGGGNVRLYEATSSALAGLYDAEAPAAVLDVGCGDGAALLPALRAARHRPERVDVVEPSGPLLQAALADLGGWPVHPWPTAVQDFLARLDGDDDAPAAWGVVQSTFALHTLPRDERTEVLRALLPRTGRLAVVEFDVPESPVGSPEHLEFLARTYEQGLAEYDDDRELVAQGFLMPVLTGQLRPGAVRATFEQPARAWVEQVSGAGFTDVEVVPVDDYWSSPAFLLTARGGAPLWREPATPSSPTPRTAPPTR